ncbi:hypothetical protein [Dendronalium sp. ChiSLP03b]|uniref:hypothetical protein n=1 Tax=Dendronalium sp. ChiSLP03b TaxID=3075381 RepID=UPI0039189F5C
MISFYQKRVKSSVTPRVSSAAVASAITVLGGPFGIVGGIKLVGLITVVGML